MKISKPLKIIATVTDMWKLAGDILTSSGVVKASPPPAAVWETDRT